MHIVTLQGLRHIGSTPWVQMFLAPAIEAKVLEAQAILKREGVELEGKPFDLIGYFKGQIPPLEHHTLTALEHPAIYVASMALWEAEKPECDAVLGFSYGEFTAATAAGCLTFREGLLTVVERGKAIGAAGGANILVRGPLKIKQLRALCRLIGGVWLGNINNTQQAIISGDPRRIVRIKKILEKASSLKITDLNLGGAVHTPLMTPARRHMKRFLADMSFREPRIPVICNATGLPETDPQRIKMLLLRQMDSRLNFLRTIRNLSPQDTFQEICLPLGRDLVTRLIRAELQARPVRPQRKLMPAPFHA